MHCFHKNASCGPERANFRTKTLHFLRAIRLNWLAKIELKGTRRSWASILLISYSCQRKVLKRNWNWRNIRLFCHIFVIGEISIGGGPSPPPLAYAYAPSEENKKGVRKFSREVSVVFQRNFNCSKNIAVLEPRTAQFSRTWGFEAKA